MDCDEFYFDYDQPIKEINENLVYPRRFTIPKNKKSVMDICIKIKYVDDIKKNYSIKDAVGVIKMFVAGIMVDSVSNDMIMYKWINDNEVMIYYPIEYSNGYIDHEECQYFDVSMYIELYGTYRVEYTKCMLEYR